MVVGGTGVLWMEDEVRVGGTGVLWVLSISDDACLCSAG